MKAIKITYRVKQEFARENQKNIGKFLQELQAINDPDLRYTVFLSEDGKTFNHLAVYNNEESQKRLLELESFRSFQQKRDDSGLEVEPVFELFTFVGASYQLF